MIWNELMKMKPRKIQPRLTIDKFLEDYPILKVSGDLQFYNDYLRMERRIINLYGESFLKELLKDKLSEIETNGEDD